MKEITATPHAPCDMIQYLALQDQATLGLEELFHLVELHMVFSYKIWHDL